MRKKLFLSLLVSCLLMGAAVAQNSTVTGRVTDEKGEPIPGASVQIKGSKTGGTAANADGTFTLKVANGASLIVSAAGFESKTVAASANVVIKLAVSINSLNEVVVTGTGSAVSKRKLAISVQSINSDKLPATPSASIDQALVGKIAGAQVTSSSGNPGSPVSIQLRGVNTIQGGSQPMVLIDGVEMGATALGTIDLNSVERVEVVQGAAAATIYGAQGANGVIQIFTKKGKGGKAHIDVSSRISQDAYINLGNVHQPYNHSFKTDDNGNIVQLTDGEYIPLKMNEFSQWGDAIWENGPTAKNNKPYKGGNKYYDHIAQTFRNAITKNNNISVSGSKDKLDYAVNLSQLDQESIVDGSLKRTNLTTNVGVEVFKGFKIRSINQLVYTESTLGNTNISAALYTYPFADFNYKDADGNHTRKMGGAGANSSNPEYYKQYNHYLSKTVDFIPSINAAYKFPKYLDIDYKFSINQSNNDYTRRSDNQSGNKTSAQYNSYTGEGLNGGIYNSLSSYTTQNSIATANLKFDFANDFGFKIPLVSTTTVAYDYRKKKSNYTANDYTSIPLYAANANQAETKSVVGVYDDLFTTFGYFANQRFDYGEYAGFSGGFRSDYSSTFGDTKKAQAFPRGDAYLRLSSFKFWDNISNWFTDFKLRAAYGEAGIQPGVFDRIITLNNQNFDNGTGFYNPSRVANPLLTVERSSEKEIGFDFNFKPSNKDWFSNISLTGTYWKRKGTNIIWVVPLPISSGASEVKTNAVDLSSHGIELSLDVAVYKSKDINWNLSAVFGKSKSFTDAIHGATDIPLVWGSAATYTLRPSEQIGTIFGYKALTSIDQTNASGDYYLDQTLKANYEIVNGRVVETESKKVQFTSDKHLLGNTTPNFNMSFTNSVSFKDYLNLSFQFDWYSGAKQYNQTKEWMYSEGLHGDFDKSVTIGGVSAPWTAYYKSFYDASESNGTKDYFLENSSFLRLRNVSLAFDAAKFWKVSFTNKLQIVFSGRNLFTVTKYTGMDPEANQNTTGAGSTGTTQTTVQRGLDYWSFPNTKSYQIGINIGL